MKADLIFLTEIQLGDYSHKELLKSVFVGHDLYLHNSSDKIQELNFIEKSGLDIRLKYFDDEFVCSNIFIQKLKIRFF